MTKYNLAEKAFLIIACLLCLLFTFMAGGCTSRNDDIELLCKVECKKCERVILECRGNKVLKKIKIEN